MRAEMVYPHDSALRIAAMKQAVADILLARSAAQLDGVRDKVREQVMLLVSGAVEYTRTM